MTDRPIRFSGPMVRVYQSTPHDRGAMDAYYRSRLGHQPHCYIVGPDGPNAAPVRLEKADMTPEEIAEYLRGWDEQVDAGDRWEDEGDY